MLTRVLDRELNPRVCVCAFIHKAVYSLLATLVLETDQ